MQAVESRVKNEKLFQQKIWILIRFLLIPSFYFDRIRFGHFFSLSQKYIILPLFGTQI